MAALFTWTSASANWTTGAKWSSNNTTGTVPGIADDASIGSAAQGGAITVTIDTSQLLTNLTMAGNTGTSTRKSTLFLTNTGVLPNGGTLAATTATFNQNSHLSGGGTIQTTGTISFSATNSIITANGGTNTLRLISGAAFTSGSLINITNFSTLEIDVSSGGNSINSGFQAMNAGNGLVLSGGSFNAGAQVIALSGGTLSLATSTTTLATTGTVTLTASGLITGQGLVAAIVNTASVATDGTILATGGVLELSGAQTGRATYKIDAIANSALKLDTALTTTSLVSFVGSTGTLTDALGTALANVTIGGFSGTDKIGVTGANSYAVSNDGTHISAFTGSDGATGLIETLTFTSEPAGITGLAGTTIVGATFTAACYLAGTKILSASGEIAVEGLAIGDMLLTANAGPQPVRWIGQRAYLAKLVNEHHRADLMPVRIAAGALADTVPAQDLFVSPEHMLVLDGVLIAARHLVNGSTITSFEDLDVVKYFHIELDQHAVIFANGAPAESYLDTGNRNMFTNVVEYAELGMPVGSVVPCLPIVSEGPALAAIRVGIADRATACGFTTSADADLHLQVDGAIVYPSAISGHSFSFDIAQSASDVRIVSRSAVPADINPASADGRRLGVAVAGLTLRGSGMSIEVLAGDKLLADGFYQADGGHRWTNGSAHVPAALLALMDGAFSVSVQLVGTDMQYPVAAQGDIVALASARVARNSVDQRRVA